MTIHERIKQVRDYYGLSQEEFGDKINIKTRAHISALERGKRNVTDRIISDVCRVYGINRRWLETGEGEMRSNESAFIEVVMTSLGDLEPIDQAIIKTYLLLDKKYKEGFRQFLNNFIKQTKSSD